MKKIKSLFERDYEGNKQAYNKVVEGCEWVLNGEGVPTQKYDGTCCMVKNGLLYRRYDCKKGKTPPEGFIPAQEPDQITGHYPGWLLVNENNNADKWFVQAYKNSGVLEDGTYELYGIHFQSNPEKVAEERPDVFIKHGITVLEGVPRDFDGLKNYLQNHYIEGIVFHRGNGDMVKIKRTDFGFEWNEKKTKR